MMYVVDMASCVMIYIQIFVEINTDFQAILRFGLRNFGNSNVFVTHGGDL
jgi:hypothetical protein